MIVFLDIDGVLANFCKGAYEAHGREWDKSRPSRWNFFEKDWKMSSNEFWEPLRSSKFWEDLEKHEGAEELFEVCRNGAERVIFLTTPGLSPDSASGKLWWITHFLGRTPSPKDYFLGSNKELLAGPDRLLIDDNEDNCKAFKKAGGLVYLWPAPYNKQKKTVKESTEDVRKMLEDK